MVRSLMFTALTCLNGRENTRSTQLDSFIFVQGTDIIMGRCAVGRHSNWNKMIYRPCLKAAFFESFTKNIDLIVI